VHGGLNSAVEVVAVYRDRIFDPSPPRECVVELSPVDKPEAFKRAGDERKEVEDGRGGKEGDDERREIDLQQGSGA